MREFIAEYLGWVGQEFLGIMNVEFRMVNVELVVQYSEFYIHYSKFPPSVIAI